MDNEFLNRCPRCGTLRIVSKTWKEIIKTFGGKSTITHTQTICPDPKCQKRVDEDIRLLEVKKQEIQQNREERMKLNKSHRVGIKLS